MDEPCLLVADRRNNIYDVPGVQACGQSGNSIFVLTPQNLIPLPRGSNLYLLPERYPIGFNLKTCSFFPVQNRLAVAAFLPPGYTQLATPSYVEKEGAKLLPLFSYTPVAWYKDAYYIPAIKVDARKNHDITSINWSRVDKQIAALTPLGNRLINHLVTCAKCHGCPNAINFFLGKLEGPLPVSPSCNARCLGCISFQSKTSCPAAQPRIQFTPTPDEIAQVALIHIGQAKYPIVSFGQGCEGEPLLAAGLIEKAVRLIRSKTKQGTIHMNTNGSLTQKLGVLFDAGLNSVRISLNSAQKEIYTRYYMPKGYTFDDVVKSMALVKDKKKFLSLNYLVMPGLTDHEDEFRAFYALVKKVRPDMIQWRNLNYDPMHYFKKIKFRGSGRLLGVGNVMALIHQEFPKLRHGYFNLSKEDSKAKA